MYPTADDIYKISAVSLHFLLTIVLRNHSTDGLTLVYIGPFVSMFYRLTIPYCENRAVAEFLAEKRIWSGREPESYTRVLTYQQCHASMAIVLAHSLALKCKKDDRR